MGDGPFVHGCRAAYAMKRLRSQCGCSMRTQMLGCDGCLMHLSCKQKLVSYQHAFQDEPQTAVGELCLGA